jgi:hypothetical protein
MTIALYVVESLVTVGLVVEAVMLRRLVARRRRDAEIIRWMTKYSEMMRERNASLQRVVDMAEEPEFFIGRAGELFDWERE